SLAKAAEWECHFCGQADFASRDLQLAHVSKCNSLQMPCLWHDSKCAPDQDTWLLEMNGKYFSPGDSKTAHAVDGLTGLTGRQLEMCQFAEAVQHQFMRKHSCPGHKFDCGQCGQSL